MPCCSEIHDSRPSGEARALVFTSRKSRDGTKMSRFFSVKLFRGRHVMRSTAKKSSRSTRRRVDRTVRRRRKVNAAATIRRMGNDWSWHWNAGELDGWSRLTLKTQFTFRRYHEAVHGRDAIREYLKVPLSRGICGLAFEVTYIKQQGSIAWDVGTYRMTIPQSDGTKKEDHGKYLTVWRRVGKGWLIAADAWSSDLPPST